MGDRQNEAKDNATAQQAAGMEGEEVTEPTLLKALREARNKPKEWPEGAMRSEDLARTLDVGVQRVRGEIRHYMEIGLVEYCEVPWKDIRGRDIMTAGYRWINAIPTARTDNGQSKDEA